MYQRAMITLFYDMMQREVKVYVDDIFVKSKKKRSYVSIEEIVWEATKIPIKTKSYKMLVRGKNRKATGFCSK